jgi:hypothetical protein
MHRIATPRVSEATAETNIQDGKFSQHMSLADSRINDSIAVVSDDPSFVATARLTANRHVKIVVPLQLSGTLR